MNLLFQSSTSRYHSTSQTTVTVCPLLPQGIFIISPFCKRICGTTLIFCFCFRWLNNYNAYNIKFFKVFAIFFLKTRSSIVCLFFYSCPSAIFFAIISIYIYPVYLGIFFSILFYVDFVFISHIAIKIFKTIIPFFTYFNSSSSISKI